MFDASIDPDSQDPTAARAKEPNVSHSRRCERLRSDSEFKQVRTEGRSWSSPLLVLQAAPNRAGTVRFGIIASKRLGKAVQRNRARRLVREAVRRLCHRLRRGWDLVIVARTGLVEASLEAVSLALEDLFSRAGLFDGPPVANESSAGGFPFPASLTSVDRTRR
ncbi:MAG TPA: ribonuclease P protein component [Chloroflexota bacterium]|nr:ribonuclease P protein component [Chloroflexota bacterium]